MRDLLSSITVSRQYPRVGADGEDLIHAFAAEIGPSQQEMAVAPAGTPAHVADIQDILMLGAMLLTVAHDRRDQGLAVGEELLHYAREAQHLSRVVERTPRGRD